MSPPRTISHAQFIAEYRGQSKDREGIVFVCPMCDTLQNAHDLIAAGAGKNFEDVAGVIGFSCVGRFTGKGSPSKAGKGNGCNWTLGGLFATHKLTVLSVDGEKCPHFELASKEEADAHRAQQQVGAPI